MRKKQSTAAKSDGKGVPEAALARALGGQGASVSGYGQAPTQPAGTRWHVMPRPHGTRWHVSISPNG